MNNLVKDEEQFNHGLKILAKSSFFIFIFLFISKLTFYIYRLVIARHFGPEIYGLFSIALIILSFFVALFSFGLDQGVLRFIPYYLGKKEKEKVKYLVRFSFKILFILSFFAGISLFYLSGIISTNIFHNEDLTIFLRGFSLLVPVYIFSYLLLAILRAHEKVIWYSFNLNVLQNLVKVLAIILLIYIGFESDSITFSFFLGVLAMFLLSFYLVKFYFNYLFKPTKLGKNIRATLRREFISYSWPLMFLGIFLSILSWTDSFMIGIFVDATSVGLYNSAVPISILIAISSEIFMQPFFPLITRAYSMKNFEMVKQISQQVGKWIFIINLPLLIIIFLFPGAIINLFFGSEYISAENALRILSIGVFFGTLTVSIPLNLLSSIGKSKLLLLNFGGITIFNIILNCILIPKYGINGAAFSTTISTFLLGTVLILESKHYTSIIPLRRKMIRIFLISIIPTSLLLFLRLIVPINKTSLILLGIFFSFSYILAIILTGCLDKNDFLIIQSFVKKGIKK